MLSWYKKLFEKGPANAEKSLLGCLVANVLIVAIFAMVYWLLGAQAVFHRGQ